jgi:hypothetical protein
MISHHRIVRKESQTHTSIFFCHHSLNKNNSNNNNGDDDNNDALKGEKLTFRS